MQYKVLSETFDVTNEDAEPTHYVQGDVIELDAERAQTAMDAGWIIPTEVTEDMLKENPVLANAGVQVGAPISVASEEESKELDEKAAAADTSEPRLRYRGQVILVESERTVGRQTFKHILIADGSEYDLTDEEYENEVKMAYPPTK